jgi:hypothetical protein
MLFDCGADFKGPDNHLNDTDNRRKEAEKINM